MFIALIACIVIAVVGFYFAVRTHSVGLGTTLAIISALAGVVALILFASILVIFSDGEEGANGKREVLSESPLVANEDGDYYTQTDDAYVFWVLGEDGVSREETTHVRYVTVGYDQGEPVEPRVITYEMTYPAGALAPWSVTRESKNIELVVPPNN